MIQGQLSVRQAAVAKEQSLVAVLMPQFRIMHDSSHSPGFYHNQAGTRGRAKSLDTAKPFVRCRVRSQLVAIGLLAQAAAIGRAILQCLSYMSNANSLAPPASVHGDGEASDFCVKPWRLELLAFL